MLALLVVLSVLGEVAGRGCFKPKPFIGPEKGGIPSPVPSELPKNFDWRNVNGTNYCSRVLTQQLPHVCGSCWAEAALGALSDRLAIATGNVLKVQLAIQALLNYVESVSGGTCMGGDSSRAYKFAYEFGVPDDTCAPFVGMNWAWGFDHADTKNRTEVLSHLCQLCTWNGECTWLKPSEFTYYSASDYGQVSGVENMMAEIYTRGPIACSLNSDFDSFDKYRGGIITEPTKTNETDHVIVLAGWGVDSDTQLPYWIGRNSYGTRWGEGAEGGWFRILRGSNTLAIETYPCSWAVPVSEQTERALRRYRESQP